MSLTLVVDDVSKQVLNRIGVSMRVCGCVGVCTKLLTLGGVVCRVPLIHFTVCAVCVSLFCSATHIRIWLTYNTRPKPHTH